MDDDEFITITPGRHARRAGEHVYFSADAVLFTPPPALDAVERADWQWDGHGTLRLRFSDTGAYKVSRSANNFSRQRKVSCGTVRREIGVSPRGSYPIARIDGNDIYIDISAAMKEAAS